MTTISVVKKKKYGKNKDRKQYSRDSNSGKIDNGCDEGVSFGFYKNNKISRKGLLKQRHRCNHPFYERYPNPCVGCINNTSEPCRFRHVRAFKRTGRQLQYGPYFISNGTSGTLALGTPDTIHLPYINDEERSYIREAIRPTTKQILDRELSYMSQARGNIRKQSALGGVRHTCDVCFSSIFNVHFLCTICGIDLCINCYELKDEWKVKNKLTGCSLDRQHERQHFLQVSKFCVDDISDLRLETSMNYPSKSGSILQPESWSLCSSSSSDSSPSLLSSKSPSKPLSIGSQSSPFGVTSLSSDPVSTYRPSSPVALSPMVSLVDAGSLAMDSSTKSPNFHTLSLPSSTVPSPTRMTNKDEQQSEEKNQHRLLVVSCKDITTEIFQRYWQEGKPAMIQDVIQLNSQADWSPEYFCSTYGNQRINAIDCHTMIERTTTVSKFFRQFMRQHQGDKHEQKGKICKRTQKPKPAPAPAPAPVLKIKDWPPKSDFSTECPRLYQDFMSMLPVPEYCTTNGKFNLSNRLPPDFIKPDLGPKMFIACGLSETIDNAKEVGQSCEVGTTNIHCDMTDAVNVMCYAHQSIESLNDSNNRNNKKFDYGVSSSPGKAAAVWDIFAYKDLPNLRKFLAQLQQERGTPTRVTESSIQSSCSSSISNITDRLFTAKVKDPLHSQWIYLTEPLLERLKKEYGIQPWRLYQNPGDAIYIPAGCAHQVINHQSAIKAAFDFLSPENVDRSADITRQLGKAQQEDVLQLNSTLVHAWISVYMSNRTYSNR